MRFKAILFDKDGTLFDFNKTWGEWFYNILNDLSDNNTILKNQIAYTVKFDLVKKCFLKESPFIAGSITETIDLIIDYLPKWNKDDLNLWFNQKLKLPDGVPVEGLEDVLNKIDQMGLKIGLSTNDSYSSAKFQLKKHNIHDYFIFISGYDSGFGSKPDTGMQEEFSRVVNHKSNLIIMVGDSLADIYAGKNSGMSTIGVLTGPASRNDLKGEADIVLDSIKEIPEYLIKYS